ncbi:hypothetical protein ACQEVF_48660 [Nonomuraea polychroma]|uniref:hypothetical protein n=1 Tax=Nonomuraea polychroma TaxID=46176 RepID=UPI003D936E08
MAVRRAAASSSVRLRKVPSRDCSVAAWVLVSSAMTRARSPAATARPGRARRPGLVGRRVDYEGKVTCARFDRVRQTPLPGPAAPWHGPHPD